MCWRTNTEFLYLFIYLLNKLSISANLCNIFQFYCRFFFSLQLLTSVTLSIQAFQYYFISPLSAFNPECHRISLPPLFIQKKKKKRLDWNQCIFRFICSLLLKPTLRWTFKVSQWKREKRLTAAVVTNLKKVCLPFVTSQKCMFHQKNNGNSEILHGVVHLNERNDVLPGEKNIIFPLQSPK